MCAHTKIRKREVPVGEPGKLGLRDLYNFYEELGKKFPEERIVYNALRGILRRKFVESKLCSMEGSLLDVGCGGGVYSAACAHQTGGYTGLDFSIAVIRRAKKAVPHANFLVCDAQNLGIRTNGVQNVLCTEVLEHLLEPSKCLGEIFRALCHNGTLLLTTPNFTSAERPKFMWLPILEKYGIKPRRILHTAFKPIELKRMLENVGFCVLEYGTLEKEHAYSTIIARIINSLSRRYLKRRIMLPHGWLYEKIAICTYKITQFFRFDKVLSKKVKEGGTSYVVAKKYNNARAKIAF